MNEELLGETKPIRWYHKLDLFAFIPVPKSEPSSSKVSLIGSLLFFFILFSYLITSFVLFITANTPKLIQTNYPLDDNEVFTFSLKD